MSRPLSFPPWQVEAVVGGGWVSNKLFLDAIAMAQVLPTPLVTFITLIGYGAGGLPSALLMTLGMFLFAFACPIFFHGALQRLLVKGGTFAAVLDGMAAVTVGIIAVTALQLLRTGVVDYRGAIIFMSALHVLYAVTHPFASIAIVAAAALAGYALFF